MRVTVAILAVVSALFVGRFVWDDIISAEDIPRGLTVDGVAIGNQDRAGAAEVLESRVVADRAVTLSWDDSELTRPLSLWGVVVDTEATIDAAEDARGGGPIRFLRWTASIVRDRTVDPIWRVDVPTLTDAIAQAPGDLTVIDSTIRLAGTGEFIATEPPAVPVVDIDALVSALLAAANDESVTDIPVPFSGFEELDDASELAAAANELTASSLVVSLAGQFEESEIPSETLREWLDIRDVDRPEDLTFAADRVAATLQEIYPDIEQASENGVQLVVGFDGEVYIIGALEGSRCCALDTADNLMDALRAGVTRPVVVFPLEAPDAEGLAWAESLGITEVVGEFTTFYTAGQTRNINIARIAELTRGAIIEPGETFSVNDHVGRRTTENGFVAAGVISNGLFSSSVGGGISQYATTLFNAAFFAGLDFGEYQSHSIYISRYPYGREATVSFGAPDLQIVNTSPYGVMIWPTTTADSVTVRLYSTPWATGEQTGQTERTEGASCIRVTTERTRTWVEDDRTEVDSVTARYRPEGVACDGSSTRPPTSTLPPTTSTIPTTVP